MKVGAVLTGLVAVLIASSNVAAEAQDYVPVTDDMLTDPAPGEWLNWRGNRAGWGYSRLDQITTENVGQLQLVWSWAIDDTGGLQAAPLVHGGVMYVPGPRGIIQALDGATGDLIWEYRPGVTQTVEGGPTTDNSGIPPGAFAGVGRGIQKNIAIYGDMLYSATGNASIVAVDARTGQQVWETQTADPELGFMYTAGPIVANGTLVTGVTGCQFYKEDQCFIAGHDPLTGEEIWRFSTIARPGEPGGDTWGDLPLEFRAGADSWQAGSYDPVTGLVYMSTSQAKPWARSQRGTAGDALYTNSSLALHPATGELEWYYQYLPGETHDMDETFESVLIDLDGRQQLFKMGKLGILWQVDRATGEFIRATDIGYQNILDVDSNTGAITYRPGMIPEIGVEINMCPSTSGFKSWRAMAYSPLTNILYIPITLNCELATFGPVDQVVGGGGNGPVRRINTLHPDSGGNLGEVLAVDVSTGEIRWRSRTPSPINTAALTTAGGLVFAGDWDRYMYAYDAVNGDVLWQTRLPTSTHGFPMSYMVNGKQYVAIPVGTGGASWSSMLPRDLAPEIVRPNNGNSIHIFSLPDS